jgi:hypothetical protein
MVGDRGENAHRGTFMGEGGGGWEGRGGGTGVHSSGAPKEQEETGSRKN